VFSICAGAAAQRAREAAAALESAEAEAEAQSESDGAESDTADERPPRAAAAAAAAAAAELAAAAADGGAAAAAADGGAADGVGGRLDRPAFLACIVLLAAGRYAHCLPALDLVDDLRLAQPSAAAAGARAREDRAARGAARAARAGGVGLAQAVRLLLNAHARPHAPQLAALASSDFRACQLYAPATEKALAEFQTLLKALWREHARDVDAEGAVRMAFADWAALWARYKLYDPAFTRAHALLTAAHAQVRPRADAAAAARGAPPRGPRSCGPALSPHRLPARAAAAQSVVSDMEGRSASRVGSLGYAEFIDAVVRVACCKPVPLKSELDKIRTASPLEFIQGQLKLGRYKAWLERAAQNLGPYAERCVRATAEARPVADDVRRLLGLVADARAYELSRVGR
jgi:hypothetical protein